MVEFYGTMKITPKYAKCDPFFVKGHWTKKNSTEKNCTVWCNEGLYKNGVNEEICEIVEVENDVSLRKLWKPV